MINQRWTNWPKASFITKPTLEGIAWKDDGKTTGIQSSPN
jgi:hypothetical protein